MGSPGGTRPDTIPQALVAAAQRFGDREAVVDGSVRLSYNDLHQRVRDCARLFIAEGIREGDRVAICSPNTHHWVEAALGALYAGATLVPINTRYTGEEILDIVRRSAATALVIAGEFLGTDRLASLREAAARSGDQGHGRDGEPVPGIPTLRTVLRVPVESEPSATEPGEAVLDWTDIPERARGIGSGELDTRLAHADPHEPSDILFTSGTTGRSKGAMSAHTQSLGVAEAWAELGGLTERDRYLVINPFFHSFGYKAGILAAILRGATIIPQVTFDAEAAFATIESERVTVLPGAPTIYQVMLDHPRREEFDISSLRLAVTGAATVPVVLVERMREQLGFDCVLTAYGLTEAAVATMCRPTDRPRTVATTCGKAAAGFEVITVATDGSGARTPPGEPGEILLRGPNVMLGYLDDPEETARAIDSEGWLHTGDVGVLDKHGYLTITDRIKDMYVSGGFNVYPAEVEQTLARLDGVSEAAVVGVADDRLGEVGKAYILPTPGADLSETDVIDHCKERLANYKVPRQVEFVSEFPRNATGKVLKRVLRDGTTSTKERA
ncbi:FadD3 family acyl-CoA ligase [Haloechinothrix sp. LS1_15]|uniref:FadD3 family acyl-CoA ligase n=1 Tax=Haloechinothrix sp. LS1_15 TaxID=2652248 RepID=UPI002946C6CD|nr:FadD3 family acyl-CoA ligase [Haloechinothrix sp. LS1_15]MDV6014167.1 AMP-binding protein [Haloechinothrix sp. LS1_15]